MRSFLDGSLGEWSAHASAGRGGLPTPARVVFVSRSVPPAPTRVLELDETRSEAEARIVTADDEALRALLETARPDSGSLPESGPRPLG